MPCECRSTNSQVPACSSKAHSTMGCAQSVFKVDADIEELYTLGKCIGQGVEGQVYLATDNSSGEQVAIKLVER